MKFLSELTSRHFAISILADGIIQVDSKSVSYSDCQNLFFFKTKQFIDCYHSVFTQSLIQLINYKSTAQKAQITCFLIPPCALSLCISMRLSRDEIGMFESASPWQVGSPTC